jgi:hypothetical protein
MKSIQVGPDDLIVSPELNRSGRSKQFEERLRASIAEVGLAEPIKVARTPGGQYVVIDGIMRLNAIAEIRATDPTAFATIPAYVVEYGRRFEIRYQTDIYQDLHYGADMPWTARHIRTVLGRQEAPDPAPALLHAVNPSWSLLERQQPPQSRSWLSALSPQSILGSTQPYPYVLCTGSEVTGDGLSCDEFPFASTYQGGEGSSLFIVPGSENSPQGTDMFNFYAKCAPNDGDAFLVVPFPQQNLIPVQPDGFTITNSAYLCSP